MPTIPRALANFSTSLASKIADTGVVSFTLSSVLTRDGSNVPAGTYGITIDEGKSNMEHMIVTIAGTTATIVTRGLSTIDGSSNVAALQFEHRRNASIKMTNHPLLIRLYLALIGTDTLDNKLKYTTNLTFTDDKELVPKKYVDDTAFNGAPDGSETTKGIYELATDTEALDGTAAGTTTAPLIPSSAQFGTYKSTHTDKSVTYRDTILAGNIVWYDTATDGYKVALATTQAHIDALAAVAYDAGVNGNTNKKVYFPGSKVTGASGLTKGAPVYLSDTGTASATTGTIRKVIGRALSATVWIFNPTVETPTATPEANKIPRGDSSATLNAWVDEVSLSKIGGDGSDGDVTIGAGTTTLTRDMYYNTLNIPVGATLKPNGYRIFYKVSCVVDGTLSVAGGAGGNAVTSTGGTAGAAGSTDGSIAGGKAGKAGANGGAGGAGKTAGGAAPVAGTIGATGTAGDALNSTLGAAGNAGVLGGAGGSGGAGGGAAGGAAGPIGAAGAVVASKIVPRIPSFAFTLHDMIDTTIRMMRGNGNNGSGGGGGGGGGGAGGASAIGGNGGVGGGAGGNGGDAGILFLCGPALSGSGTINYGGGAGGNGANGTNGSDGNSNGSGNAAAGGGGGGGGAAGNGGNAGVFINIYHTNTFAGTTVSTGGAAGTVGAGGNPGANAAGAGSYGPANAGSAGTAGATGKTGVAFTIQL